jgi:acyl dehydratase
MNGPVEMAKERVKALELAHVPVRFALAQGPVVRGMLGAALAAALPGEAHEASVPGPWHESSLPPREDALIDAYLQEVGGSASRDRRLVPPHLFPQWAFADTAKVLRGLRLPMSRAVNAGCRLEIRGDLPRGERLVLRSRLESVEKKDGLTLITERFLTGTERQPELVVADLRVIVPTGGSKKRGEKKEPPRADRDAAEVKVFEVDERAGLRFSMLTGDFNPLHWSKSYARAMGWRTPILHGFGTFARAYEALAASGPVRVLDAKFTRPLALPNRATLVRNGQKVWVVDRQEIAVMEGVVS